MKTIHILLVGCLTILASAGCLAQNGHDLFQKALVKERTEGDLEAAIALHERIANECADDRPLAAKALLHLGRCYEKLGKEEARKAYERLVQDYADQTDMVAEARARLNALSASGSHGTNVAIRQVSSIPYTRGAPSPDGCYLTYGNWETGGDLALLDLRTGDTKLLTQKGPECQDFALYSRWSPDSQKIAYDWFVDPEQIELRVVGREGGEARTVARFAWNEWIRTYDWSPRSAEILVLVEREGGTRQITAISELDGSLRVLKTFEGRGPYPRDMRFSPDGEWVAFDLPPDPDMVEHDVFRISASGGEEAVLVQHPADDALFGWIPNGQGLLFASDRAGTMDLWFLPMNGATSVGEPQMIRRAVEAIRPLGFDQSGAFYYSQIPSTCDLFTFDLEPRPDDKPASPEKSVRRFEGSNRWGEYSPDGKQLAYVRDGNLPMTLYTGRRLAVLCIRSVRSGEEREIRSRFDGLAGPRWSPDSEQIYLAGQDRKGLGLYRVDLRTGEFSAVVPPTDDFMPCGGHAVTPDGKTLVYERRPAGTEVVEVMMRDLASGEEKRVCRVDSPHRACSIALSPDGERLALVNQLGQRVVRVIPLATGEPQEVVSFEEDAGGVIGIDWSADGKYIVFPRKRVEEDGGSAGTEWWRVALEGGEPERVGLSVPNALPLSLSVHPDGTHALFSAWGFASAPAGTWLMDNFIPTLADAK